MDETTEPADRVGGSRHRDRGASMVEYTILVGVIAGVVLLAALFIGGQISAIASGINIGA